jgi:hypothetical protein
MRGLAWSRRRKFEGGRCVLQEQTGGRAGLGRCAAMGLVILVSVLAAEIARATVMPVEATLTVEYGTTDPLHINGVGVATVNPIAGGDRLISLQVGSIDFGDSDSVLFTDPVVSALVKSYNLKNVVAQSDSFFNLSHATTNPANLTQNTFPLSGIARICLLFSGCLSSTTVVFDLTQNGTRGIGIGGTVTGGATTGFHVSLFNAPWQLAPATLIQSTVGGTFTVMGTGYAIGPLSNTSTAAKAGGSVQLIAPTRVMTQGIPGGYSEQQALFTRLTLSFVPEPGLLLVFGPGVLALALLGRRRMHG